MRAIFKLSPRTSLRPPSDNNVWYQQHSPQNPCPPLHGQQHCDVIVVGGGLAGLSSALHLARQGRRVILLEARRLAWAASGRNGGQVLNAFACDLPVLRQRVGLEHSQRLWDLAESGVRWVEQWVRDEAVACGMAKGSLYVAIRPGQIAALRELQEESEQLYGYHGLHWVTREALPQYVNSPRYCAGLYDAHSLHLDPWQLSHSLARAAQQAGAQCYEHSPVQTWQCEYHQGQRGFSVHTDQASVWAPELLFCTNTGLSALLPGISAHVIPMYSYLGVTPRLSAEQAEALIPAHCAVSDTNAVLDYYRRTEDQRLLFGGLIGFSSRPPMAVAQRLQRRMRKVFPQLAGIRLEQYWGGVIDLSYQRIPHFGRLDQGAYFVHGFSGHGVALACLSGRLLSEALQGQSEGFDCFAQIPPQAYPGPALLRRPLGIAQMIGAAIADRLSF